MKLIYVLNFCFIIVQVALANASEKLNYNNYKVISILSENEEQLEILLKLQNDSKYDFWKRPTMIGQPADVMVSPEHVDDLVAILKKNKFNFKISIEALESLLNEENASAISDGFSKTGMEWTNYHNLSEIYDWLNELADIYPEQVTLFQLPRKSFEGRNIIGVKISYKANNSGIFIESNMHAREWITSASATWLINELLTSENVKVRNIAENIDWYIVPVLNPDGFVYSHEKDRMWRKTRQPHGSCVGADPNRNFDFLWMVSGASNDPCSQTYAGPKAHSEPEILGLTEYINTLPANKFKLYLSFHSYGQMALSPWGHTNKEFPANYDDMLRVGGGFANRVQKRFGTQYRYGASSVVLYNVSGSSKEWAYGVKKIPFTYTLELRDKGKYGFVLPPSQILPTAEETLDGIIGMIEAMPKKYKLI